MLETLTILLVFQLAGEAISRGFDLPVPGPVIGFILLLGALRLRAGVPEELRVTATGLLRHFSLLFVPAGTGVMVHLSRLRDEWLPISVALIVSTLLTIACMALVMNWLMRRFAGREEA
jgi:holin-like protein